MVSKGFPNVVTLGQQCNIVEKPASILHTYINRHAETLKSESRMLRRSRCVQIFL